MAAANTVSTTKRRRRQSTDSRSEALKAARRLVVEGQDPILTLRAVADAIGVTYPNLSHHFGSLSGLYAALAEDLLRELLAGLRSIEAQMEDLDDDPQRIVDQVFNLFGAGGLGRVITWLVKVDNRAQLIPLRAMLSEFIEELTALGGHSSSQRVAEIALIVTFAAYAEAAVGPLVGQVLDISHPMRRNAVIHTLDLLRSSPTRVNQQAQKPS